MAVTIETENKADFVRKFFLLISENTSYFSDLYDMAYVKETNGEEYIYATYKNTNRETGEVTPGPQRRICVTADSCKAIIQDFVTQIGSAPWVDPEHRYTGYEKGE